MIDLHLTNKSVRILSKLVKLFQHNRLQGGQKPQDFGNGSFLNLTSGGHWCGHDVILYNVKMHGKSIGTVGFDATLRLPHMWIPIEISV
jgi:hypothetical protein